MGFEQAGWECLWQVEWDKNCQQILQFHWPEVPKYEDVCDVDGTRLEPVDCIIFGSPCQDLSVAGKRAGLDGDRSNLFFQAVRIIKEMRDATRNEYPRIVVWENVAGALSSNKGDDFQAVLQTLGDIGALEQEWHLLDARWFGVPQRRRRVFLTAVFDPAIAGRGGQQILPVASRSGWNPPQGGPSRQTTTRHAEQSTLSGVEQQIDDDQLLSFDSQFGSYAGVHDNISPPVKVGSGVGISSPPAIAYSIRKDAKANTFSATEADTSLALNALRPSPQSHHAQLFIAQPFVKVIRPQTDQHPEVWRQEETAPTLNRFDNTGESRATVVMPVVFENSYRDGPQVGKGVSHTLPAKMETGGGNTPMIAENSYAVRRLTPIECERLMGWPDNHTRWKADGTEQADSHRYKQCGNGVATPVARWIAKHLRELL